MPRRALWPRLILCAAAFGAVSPLPVRAQEKPYLKRVVRYVDHVDDGKVRYLGKPTMVLRVEPLEGGGPIDLYVPNRGQGDIRNDKYDPIPQVAETVRDLKRGDVIKIELDHTKPRPFVREADRYQLKPGESEPNVYVFKSNFRKEDGRSNYMAVVLSRFDEQTTVAVQQKRDREGDMVSEPAILELLQKLRAGELVEAEIKEGGRTPVLTSLERYAPPQTAKFVRMSEAEVEGQKAPAVELQRGDKTLSATIVGKMQGKRWSPDSRVLSAAKKLKPDNEVVFRVRDDDGKLWLKEIEPAPKEPAESSVPGSRASRDDDNRGRRSDMSQK